MGGFERAVSFFGAANDAFFQQFIFSAIAVMCES